MIAGMKRLLWAGLLTATFLSSAEASTSKEITFGVNAFRFDYKEKLELPLKSTEEAMVYTGYLAARYPVERWGRSYWQIEADLSGSTNSKFDGSTQAGTPVTDTNHLSFFRGEISFYAQASETVFVYSGWSYRYWNRFLSGGTGYREIYTWNHLPLGLLLEMPSAWAPLAWAIDASYRLMFAGQIKVIFSETVIAGEDTLLTLGNKPTLKLQVPVRYTWNGTPYRLSLTPWWETSEFGESEFKYNSTMAGSIQEPASKTYQWGLLVGWTTLF